MPLLSCFNFSYSFVTSGRISDRFGTMKSMIVFGMPLSIFRMMSLVISFLFFSRLSYLVFASLSLQGSSLLQFRLLLWMMTLAKVFVL